MISDSDSSPVRGILQLEQGLTVGFFKRLKQLSHRARRINNQVDSCCGPERKTEAAIPRRLTGRREKRPESLGRFGMGARTVLVPESTPHRRYNADQASSEKD